ncbi:MAG: 6-phosphogluconolactonase [Melioribacteraceae bacterium]|nr:6-phosphogluconolactonase [Melioribacteraceae bacterium]
MIKKIKVFNSGKLLADFFANEILNKLESIDEKEYLSIAFSGGSTPKKVFEYISKNYSDKIAWEKVRIFWSDERCVPPDNEESNYKMAYDSLLKNISIPEENIFRIFGETDPLLEVIRYKIVLKGNIPLINKIPSFDMMMLGLGDDGHTASIFPNNISLFSSEEICINTQHPETGQERITLTGKLINNSKNVYFFVTGKGKAKIVKEILSEDNSNKNYPASLVEPVDSNLYWLLDKGAASGLKK